MEPLKPDLPEFSKPNPALAECFDLPEALQDALNVSATDLVAASRIAREEAIRLRSIGMHSAANIIAGIAVATLDGRITANDTHVSPLEYAHLNRELVGTLMLQADLAATVGDYKTARRVLNAARNANYRSEPDQREDLTDQTRVVLESVIANGSIVARLKARRQLKTLPESRAQTLETKLKAVDLNIDEAHRQWPWDGLPNHRIAQEWLKWGDAHSVEQARLVALFRIEPGDTEGALDLDEDAYVMNLLLLCAKSGNVEAAHDFLGYVKKLISTNPNSWRAGSDLAEVLIAGLFVESDEVIDEALEMAHTLRAQEAHDTYGLSCIALAEAQIRAGERDPYKIDGLYKRKQVGDNEYQDSSYILLGILNEKPRISAPQF